MSKRRSLVNARAASRAIMTGVNKAHRQTLRHRLGSLFGLRVAPGTAKRYAVAYAAFANFVATRLLAITTLAGLDGALAQYIEHLWEEGESRNHSQDGIAAVQFFVPSCRGRLNLSWSLCGAWGRHELPSRALPLTPELLAAVCGAFLRAGMPRIALGSVLGFAVLARTGELLTLMRHQVFFDADTVIIFFRPPSEDRGWGLTKVKSCAIR